MTRDTHRQASLYSHQRQLPSCAKLANNSNFEQLTREQPETPSSDLIDRDSTSKPTLDAWQKRAEGLGSGTRDHGLIFSLNAHRWTNSIQVLKYGSEEERRKYLPRPCNGKSIGANAAAEPYAISCGFIMRTHARRSDNQYVLNGSRSYVSNAPIARLFLVYATLDPKYGVAGITVFINERGMPGMFLNMEFHRMGLRTSPMAEVTFRNCCVPETQRLGKDVAFQSSSASWSGNETAFFVP